MNGEQLYAALTEELKDLAEPDFAAFSSKLLHNEKLNVLGVRVPILRGLSKKYAAYMPELLNLPDEYFEVTFIKLLAAARLPYERFITISDRCVSLIDNWQTCDSFAPRCIARNKDDYFALVNAYMGVNSEFYQRFALVTLLHFYVEEDYLQRIFALIGEANLDYYYVHMAVAWLLSECAVKYFDETVNFLLSHTLPPKTHNKAIQKCLESFRLTQSQKQYLKLLRI